MKKARIVIVLIVLLVVSTIFLFIKTHNHQNQIQTSKNNVLVSTTKSVLLDGESNDQYEFEVQFDAEDSYLIEDINIQSNGNDKIFCTREKQTSRTILYKCIGTLDKNAEVNTKRKISVAYQINDKQYNKNIDIKLHTTQPRIKDQSDDLKVLESPKTNNTRPTIQYASYAKYDEKVSQYRNSDGYKNNWYTDESKRKVEDHIQSIDRSKTIDKQQEVDQYVMELTNRINKLKYRQANYELLNNKIEEYKASDGYQNDWYTDESREEVESYIESFDLNITIDQQERVDNYLYELMNRVTSLELKDASYEQYDTFIETIHSSEYYTKEWFTEEYKNRLDNYINAIDRSLKINEQSRVDAYTAELQHIFVAEFELKSASYTELNNVINNYKESYAYKNNWYTEECVEELDEYISSLNQNIKIDQQEIVDQYVIELTNKISKSEYRLANYELLNNKIEEYETSDGYINNWYTEDSKEEVDGYIESFDLNITIDHQKIVDDYLYELTNKVARLELKGASYELFDIFVETIHSSEYYKNDWYTEEYKNRLDTYIKAIDRNLKINEQSRVDAYTAELQHIFIVEFELKLASYTELNNVIINYRESYEYINNWYTDEGIESLDEYISSLNYNVKINQQEIVDQYVIELTDKISKLEYRLANYELLNNKIEEYENSDGYKNNWYTEDSKEEVEDYIESLNLFIKIDQQEIVDNYLYELTNKVSRLELKEASYELFDEKVSEYHSSEEYINNLYTEESQQVVDDFIASVNHNLKVNEQDVVDEYVEQLIEKINLLELQSRYLFKRPTTSGTITAPYGYVSGKLHDGVDIAVPYGTPIYAVGAGTVYRTGQNNIDGKFIVIHHIVKDVAYTSYYSHLSSINVQAGDVVLKDTMIGQAGNTGSTTGTHLHLSILTGRLFIDYNSMNNHTINPYNVIDFPPLHDPYEDR